MLKSIHRFRPLVSVIIFIDAFVTIIIGFSLPITTFGQLEIQQKESSSNNKVVILTFGNAPKSQYTDAKPILDKYGFKASFFVVCNWISDSDKDNSHMTWQDIQTLYNDGHDIGAKSLNHKDLTTLSASELDFEVGDSKKCLDDQNIDARVFGTPYGKGWDNPTVIDTISKYYDFAITGFSKLMYLNCDGWNEQEEVDSYNSNVQTDCRTYFDDGTLTYANRYSIKEWSHSNADKEYFGNDQIIFEEFVKAVNSQDEFNGDGTIRAIPIIAYHDLDHNMTPDSTSVNLFDTEMKYLYDNGFTVLTMADLGYDQSTHQLYIEYIGPSTINHIGPTTTTQTEAVPDDDDDDAEEVDDMGLELEDNDADIGFDNGETEEDYEGNSNELLESNTGVEEDDDENDDGNGAE
ncbi:MAG: polysaccharide deacetylase family protein [Thermoproteota archaeon]|nr:polysaccharide deacetylase family protein [Thermoproteota archaeon]